MSPICAHEWDALQALADDVREDRRARSRASAAQPLDARVVPRGLFQSLVDFVAAKTGRGEGASRSSSSASPATTAPTTPPEHSAMIWVHLAVVLLHIVLVSQFFKRATKMQDRIDTSIDALNVSVGQVRALVLDRR